MSNVLNDSNKPPVNPGARVQHPDSQGGISSPFNRSNLNPSQHPALRGGIAGNSPITNPLLQPQKPARG